MKVLNLTQHKATHEQIAQGVFESLHGEYISKLLTFAKLPSQKDLAVRALELACLAFTVCNDARGEDDEPMYAMIGGATFFMAPLAKALIEQGVTPLYAFSERVSVEVAGADGTVTKTNVFRHIGFVGGQQ